MLDRVADIAETDAALMDLAAILRNKRDWHPITLRSDLELAGWAGLDLPARVGGHDWPAARMAQLFRQCGRLDLELRDLVGGGHARLMTLAPARTFDALLATIARGAAYCAVAITEPDIGSDVQAIATTAVPCADGASSKIGYERFWNPQPYSRILRAQNSLVGKIDHYSP